MQPEKNNFLPTYDLNSFVINVIRGRLHSTVHSSMLNNVSKHNGIFLFVFLMCRPYHFFVFAFELFIEA